MEENYKVSLKARSDVQMIDLRTDRGARTVHKTNEDRKERQSDRNGRVKQCQLRQNSENITKVVDDFKRNIKLPKLSNLCPGGTQDVKNPLMAHSAIYSNLNLTQIRASDRLSYINNDFTVNENQKEYFRSKLTKILEEGILLEKSTNSVIRKAKKTGLTISRNYGKLCQNSNSLLNGVQQYRLQQEKTKKYKDQIRNMWMRYDK